MKASSVKVEANLTRRKDCVQELLLHVTGGKEEGYVEERLCGGRIV